MTQTTYRAPAETLGIYLPAPLVEQWARVPEQPALWGHWLSGSLMFCDISGFTAMSESLAQRGKEGAELMAAVLNRFFERMIVIADGWGGMQMKFGGDAMLLLFSEEGHAERAVAAGLEMQKAMSAFSRLTVGADTYPLKMRVAIHSGRFFGASVGQADGILHYLLVGPEVNRTAEIEGAGILGQVVVTDVTAAQLPVPGSLKEVQPGVFLVRGVMRTRPLPKAPSGSAPGAMLQRYLLPPLALPLLEGRLPSLSGEHRRVTAVFINLLGISPLLETKGDAQALAQTDAYIKMVISALERHGGFLAGSDLATKGDKLICLFGAPVSVEDGEAAALRAVLELDAELGQSGLELQHRIGINSGFVFAGEIGSSLRREYTVIGDSVNLAARLMAAAKPGEILASKQVIERAGSGFRVQRLKSIRVKGKAAPIVPFRVREATEDRARELLVEPVTPLFGREAELSTLLRLARQVKSRERLRWAHISGDPGIGKSRLTSELVTGLLTEGWRQFAGSCQPHTRHTPFSAWRELLRTLIGIGNDDLPDTGQRKLESAIQSASPELAPFASLLCELLSLPVQENEQIAFLEPRERRRYLTAMVVELVGAATRDRPLLLLFEDIHWADAPSLELLAAILSDTNRRLLAVVTSRDSTPPVALTATGAPVRIALAELPPEAARNMVASVPGLTEDAIQKIVSRGQGNPLFLHEISQIGAIQDESLPETVNDVILARLDRLPPEEKSVLRFASVIGPSFSLEMLHAAAGGVFDENALLDSLSALKAQGFARDQMTEPPSYAFSHILTREVAYETMPFAQRRQLHHRLGQYIEGRDANALEMVCELLLHHYAMSEDSRKTVLYAAMSGDKAAAVFAGGEAINYYGQALWALQENDRFAADDSLLRERLGDCLEMAGQYREAAQTFAEALAKWRSATRRPGILVTAGRPAARESALSRKIAQALERCSDYDESLRWLDRALSALPARPGGVAAQICATKSLTLFRKALYNEAVLWGRMGLARAGRGGDRRQLAYAHHIVAGSYMEIGKLQKALHHDRVSVRLYHELRDLPGQARANSNLGLSYQTAGVLDAALYHYEVALDADKRTDNASHAQIVQSNIAEVLFMMGRLEEAQAHSEDVIHAYHRGIGRADVAGLAEVNISRCLMRRGDLVGAARHARRSLRLLGAVGAEGHRLEANLHLAELQLAGGAAKQARRRCLGALRIAKSLSATRLEARAQRLLGRAEAALDETARAQDHLRASVAIARQVGAEYEEALSLIELSRVLLPSPRTRTQAGPPLQRAIGVLSRMGAALDLQDARKLLLKEGTFRAA